MLDFPKNVLKNKDLHPKFPFFIFIEKFVKICCYVNLTNFFHYFFPWIFSRIFRTDAFSRKTLQVYQFYILQHDVNQDYLLFQQPFQYWDYPSFNLTEFLTTKYSTNFAFSFGIFQVFIQKSFLDFVQKIVSSYF